MFCYLSTYRVFSHRFYYYILPELQLQKCLPECFHWFATYRVWLGDFKQGVDQLSLAGGLRKEGGYQPEFPLLNSKGWVRKASTRNFFVAKTKCEPHGDHPKADGWLRGWRKTPTPNPRIQFWSQKQGLI
jgi:hypothetical protein